MKLRIKFLLSISLLILIIVGIIVIVVNHLEERSIFEDRRVSAFDLVYVLAHSSVQAVVADDYVVLQEILDSVHSKKDIIHAMILDTNGRILVHNETRKIGQTIKDPLALEAIQSDSEHSVRVKYEGTVPAWDVSVPVLISNERVGTARVIFSLESAYREIAKTRNTVLAIGAFAIIGGILLSTLLGRVIARPLYTLVDATRRIGKGELSHRVRIHSGDEIGELAVSFNQMADDLVERGKQLEEKMQQLSELSRYNENILQSMSSGVITVDLSGKIITFNKSAERITGLRAEDVTGKNPRELYSPFGQLILKTLNEKKNKEIVEERFKNVRGDERTLQINTRRLLDTNNNVIGILTVFNDLTELKKLEEDMKQAERLAALGTTAASIAHEIRTPLTSLSTFAELLPMKYDDPKFRERFQSIVPPQIDRLTNLVNDLLDFARVDKPVFQETHINHLVNEAADLFTEKAKECGVTISLDLSPTIPIISADPDQITQVILNVIQNAFQAMPEGGSLRINTACNESESRQIAFRDESGKRSGFVVVSFTDTGVGIAKESLDKLFEPFFSTKSKGTGLGLAISDRIVSEHGGYIEAQSIIGKGTQFAVHLPVPSDEK